MTGHNLRQKYLNFFSSKPRNHLIIPSAPLVPENDPTTLFNSSGMQPLVPYLLGQPHPSGQTRLVNSQKCLRTQDISEVGDNRHTTFFEMLGNWSLGDYFKTDQLTWIWNFLTQELKLPKEKLYVTVYQGGDGVPRDEDTYQIWKSLGIPEDHIFFYPSSKNWWSRSGTPQEMPSGEIGGPDSEVFFEFTQVKHDPKYGQHCHPNCDCGRFLEIANSVFIQYQKQTDGSLKELSQKNVDFGGGLERILAAINDQPDIFMTDLFQPIISEIEALTNLQYSDHQTSMRIIADHLKAAVFLINEGVEPSNKLQGYVLRRLIRRSIVKLYQLSGTLKPNYLSIIAKQGVISTYQSRSTPPFPNFFDSNQKQREIFSALDNESQQFIKTLDKGLKQLNQLSPFDLYQTYGFPVEITQELYAQQGRELDLDQFNQELKHHQDLSRTAGKGMFQGGLQDHSQITTKYHTATHLLHQALRQVLGNHVRQTGSNITHQRLRFDFTHDQPLSDQQLQQVEDLVNQQIKNNLTVTCQTMSLQQARSQNALAFFAEKYGDQVKVYSIGNFSKEVCGGPHVANTADIGPITIYKQESVGSGRRRLYAKIV